MGLSSFESLLQEIRHSYQEAKTEKQFVDECNGILGRFWCETRWKSGGRPGRKGRYRLLILQCLSNGPQVVDQKVLVAHVERELNRLVREREAAIENENAARHINGLPPLQSLELPSIDLVKRYAKLWICTEVKKWDDLSLKDWDFILKYDKPFVHYVYSIALLEDQLSSIQKTIELAMRKQRITVFQVPGYSQRFKVPPSPQD